MGKHILYISDFDSIGSGYLSLSLPICLGLVAKGYELKAMGLNYNGSEHEFPFSIIPCKDFPNLNASVHNMHFMWGIDAIIVALDIPIQTTLIEQYKYLKKPYIAIVPLENGPVTSSWAGSLVQMNKVFFISELGKKEGLKAGVEQSEHLAVGIDTVSWKQRTPEEKLQFRGPLGFSDDDFIILTVADNHERKNLMAALDIVGKVKESAGDRKIRYVIVTREHSQFGMKIRDHATELGINDILTIFERGMPQRDLWGLYAMSDMFLLTSKAEGLGLPVMEAMSVGVPVVATNTGALPELLGGDRGFLVDNDYEYRDIWGNEWRSLINVKAGAKQVLELLHHSDRIDLGGIVKRAREYVEGRTFDKSVDQIDAILTEILPNDTETKQEQPEASPAS